MKKKMLIILQNTYFLFFTKINKHCIYHNKVESNTYDAAWNRPKDYAGMVEPIEIR